MSNENAQRFLRRSEVCRLVGLSRSHISELEARGEFPRHVKISVRASAWLEAEIVAWQQACIAARDSRHVA